ncbi:MAG: rRNA maturation RNase YbeY [Candidatus Ancillula sp.]|jgi:probable rRNA maturation factor|nr:rRNA maturation RNase YbeY [Candidatus Ancillula sp.]
MPVDVFNDTDFCLMDTDDFVQLSLHIFEELGINPAVSLNILFVTEEEMKTLNKLWMDEDSSTDVLSFPLDEFTANSPIFSNKHFTMEATDLELGDIAICPFVADKQAKLAKHTAHEEMLLLTTHGILHILGYDHAEVEEEIQMFELQRRLLVGYIAKVKNITSTDVKIEGLPKGRSDS